MAPNSEAPAEIHFFVPHYKVLNMAENATQTFHNLLPFRGADVRDALAVVEIPQRSAASMGRQGRRAGAASTIGRFGARNGSRRISASSAISTNSPTTRRSG